jgi:hypothetical protein
MKTYTAIRMYNVEVRATVQASSPEEAAEAVGGYLECRFEADGDTQPEAETDAGSTVVYEGETTDGDPVYEDYC